MVEVEPATSAGEQSKTYALDRAATLTGAHNSIGGGGNSPKTHNSLIKDEINRIWGQVPQTTPFLKTVKFP
jgi:hypothetical protein